MNVIQQIVYNNVHIIVNHLLDIILLALECLCFDVKLLILLLLVVCKFFLFFFSFQWPIHLLFRNLRL